MSLLARDVSHDPRPSTTSAAAAAPLIDPHRANSLSCSIPSAAAGMALHGSIPSGVGGFVELSLAWLTIGTERRAAVLRARPTLVDLDRAQSFFLGKGRAK